LGLLLHARYILQIIYLGIVYGKLTPPGFYSYFNELYEDISKYDPNPDRDHLEFYLRDKTALCRIENTVYDLFENPEKHKQLIEEGRYLDEILKRYCK